VRAVEVDTDHFKGNFPDRCSIEGIAWAGAPVDALLRSDAWAPVLPETRLRASRSHRFQELLQRGPFSHLRLNVLPCGGVSRFRVHGTPAAFDPGSDPWLAAINALPEADAVAAMLRCCGSSRWAHRMAEQRPYPSRAALFGTAETVWWKLGDGDWREAFGHHPRIGANLDELRRRFAATADWSAREQAGLTEASELTLAQLADGNEAYQAKFGYVFLVCATGLSADEMLRRLRDRMDNDPAQELRVAAGEQSRITRIRLEKL
jgi:allantoicase